MYTMIKAPENNLTSFKKRKKKKTKTKGKTKENKAKKKQLVNIFIAVLWYFSTIINLQQ